MLTTSQIKSLCQIMQPLFTKHGWLLQQLEIILKQQSKKERWEKNKILLAFIITLLLCAIIFFATKNK